MSAIELADVANAAIRAAFTDSGTRDAVRKYSTMSYAMQGGHCVNLSTMREEEGDFHIQSLAPVIYGSGLRWMALSNKHQYIASHTPITSITLFHIKPSSAHPPDPATHPSSSSTFPMSSALACL